MTTPVLTRTFAVAATLNAYTLAGQGSTQNTVLQSVSLANNFIGVVGAEGSAGGYAPIHLVGVVKVRAGASVTAGNKIGSDSAGLGVPITLAATGANVRQVCGTALTSAASGELFDMLIQPFTTLGA
jgi:hypothetical protein